jgi:NAD(P)-dependent dehydrogenase (short-subunit alcohol dehydrogenase family)
MASVLITGTSTGIGLATALASARAGHQVHATMRDPARAPELAQIAAKERLPIKISAMDVDSDSSVREVIAGIYKNGGGIDVLVNNAGIERRGSIEELPFNEFRAVMETNYFGAIRCIQAVVPHMRKRGAGCIINVSSVAGRISSSPMAPYTASKWALEALSEALAQEMKPHNVRVAIVEPGIISTRMANQVTESPQSIYPHVRRFASMFIAALKNPAPPSLVADRILEIIDSGTWVLRHPVGPNAIPFLQWRASMTDEQWVDWGAMDDDAWYAAVERDFGLTIVAKASTKKTGT